MTVDTGSHHESTVITTANTVKIIFLLLNGNESCAARREWVIVSIVVAVVFVVALNGHQWYSCVALHPLKSFFVSLWILFCAMQQRLLVRFLVCQWFIIIINIISLMRWLRYTRLFDRIKSKKNQEAFEWISFSTIKNEHRGNQCRRKII